MNTYIITYWTCGDALVTDRRVEADTMKQATEMLKADPQEPLGQVKNVRVAMEEKPS